MVNNFDITFEETVDPRGINCGEDRYNDYGCCRVAVQQDYEIPPKLMPASRIAQKSPQKWPKFHRKMEEPSRSTSRFFSR